MLKNLEPQGVFHYFEELCTIPHGSFHTKAVSDWLVSFAGSHHLSYIRDHSNNVIICKAASAGYENAEPLILQAILLISPNPLAKIAADCYNELQDKAES